MAESAWRNLKNSTHLVNQSSPFFQVNLCQPPNNVRAEDGWMETSVGLVWGRYLSSCTKLIEINYVIPHFPSSCFSFSFSSSLQIQMYSNLAPAWHFIYYRKKRRVTTCIVRITTGSVHAKMLESLQMERLAVQRRLQTILSFYRTATSKLDRNNDYNESTSFADLSGWRMRQ